MSWDDGKHTKVKKIKLTFDDIIKSIEVEYHGTNLKSQPRGTTGSKSDGFTLSSDEYITEVTGYYKTTFSGDVITALTFKTNKNTYGPYGNKTRNYFSVNAPNNNQIAGFFGTSGDALESIDVHFAPIPPAGSITGGSTVSPGGSGSNTGGSTVTPGGSGTNTGGDGAKPGDTGNTGSNTGGSTVTPGGSGSNTGGSTVTPGGSGSNTDGSGTKPSGTGNTGSNTGGEGNGTGKPGGAGSNTGSNTDSNPQKLEAQGGKGGKQWDDGSDHDGVTNIHIAPGSSGIEQIKFDYLKNGETKEGSVHGVRGRSLISTFEIDHPNEYLVSVKLWFNSSSNIIQGIQFKTNIKASDYFGFEFSGDGTEVTLEVKDKKIIGFHGFADSHLNSLGAYFVPISSTPLKPAVIAKKLKGIGGEEGALWDDGDFDGVRKVYVGQYHDGVSFVKFEYDKGSKVIVGDDHGKKSLLGVEPFELDYPSEYITAIGVYYDKVYGDKGGITLVTSLIFKTNKRTSQPFGMSGGEYVELKEEGHKIVGFHGKAADYVHQIGVYVAAITN